jgi:hypothetical protein
VTKSSDDPLVAQAFDKTRHEELARAVEKLTPDEAAFFLLKLEASIRKRKTQIVGYLVAMLVWVLAMLGALAYFGTHDGFVGWVFLIPFGFVGVTLFAFGKWSERVAARTIARGTVGTEQAGKKE